MPERFVELIADSKSTFVSKLSFGFLLAWLGVLLFLKFFDIGMPESLIISHSTCTTLKEFDISGVDVDNDNAVSCPMMVKTPLHSSKIFNPGC